MLKGMCKKINQVAKKRWCFDLLVLIAVVISIFLWDMNGQLKIANLSLLGALYTFFVGVGITVIFEIILWLFYIFILKLNKVILIILGLIVLVGGILWVLTSVVSYVDSITPVPESGNIRRNGILITLAGLGGYCGGFIIKLLSWLYVLIFMKMEMRVAKVLNCEAVVKDNTELLKFELDFGFETRIIFSDIAASYPDPTVLKDRMVIAVANFAPCKMAKFGVSEDMILSVARKGQQERLDVDTGVQPGDKVD